MILTAPPETSEAPEAFTASETEAMSSSAGEGGSTSSRVDMLLAILSILANSPDLCATAPSSSSSPWLSSSLSSSSTIVSSSPCNGSVLTEASFSMSTSSLSVSPSLAKFASPSNVSSSLLV